MINKFFLNEHHQNSKFGSNCEKRVILSLPEKLSQWLEKVSVAPTLKKTAAVAG